MITGVFRLLSYITPVLIVAILSKFALVEEVGQINYFIALITILGVFSDFGIPEVLQSIMPKGKIKSVRSYMVMELGLVGLTAVVFLGLDYLLSGSLSRGYSMLVILSILTSANNVVLTVFNGLQNKFKASLYYATTSLLFIGVTCILYFSGSASAVEAFLWGRVVSWGVFLLIALVDLNHLGYLIAEKTKLGHNSLLIQNFLYRAFYSLFLQWDAILINLVGVALELGVFKSVALMANTPFMFVTIFNTADLPQFSSLLGQKKFSTLKKIYYQQLITILAMAILATVASIPLTKLGLELVFNSEIANQGHQYFLTIFIASWLYVLTTPAISLIQASEKVGFLTICSAVHIVLFAAATFVLYPVVGVGVLPVAALVANAFLLAVLSLRVNYLLTNNK
jgi:O-antigen/teichoic acid export membrane protein